MDRNHHIIRTQRIEIDLPSDIETSGVSHRIGDVFNERILPKMEQLFDQYGGSAALLSFDRLAVDCGTLESANWEDQLVERTLSQLSEVLAQEAVATNGSRWAMAHAAIDAWCHFLTRGYLPWNRPVSNLAAFEDVLPADDMLVRRLLDAIRQTPVALDRLLGSFSSRFHVKILAAVSKVAEDSVLERLMAVLPATWRQEAWLQRAVLLALAGNDGGHQQHGRSERTALSAYAQQLLHHVPTNRLGQVCRAIGAVYGETDSLLGTVFLKQYRNTGIIETLAKAVIRHSEKAARRWEQELATADGHKNSQRATLNDPASSVKLAPSTEPNNAERRNASTKDGRNMRAAGVDNVIFVENAGVVLVHPFLNPLFETLGWVERGVFKTPESAGMAVLLVQYMVQGDEPINEAMLPLNKILCGLSAEQFVEVTKLPGADAKREADNMLGAVIEHWQALKNTSIDGLRETFLCRSGKLEHNGEGWALHVEAKSLDILLNQLPWGISLVKLPWSRGMLHVNWI